jgi:hypothetical protein
LPDCCCEVVGVAMQKLHRTGPRGCLSNLPFILRVQSFPAVLELTCPALYSESS